MEARQRALRVCSEILVLAELDGLRHIVFGDGEIFGSEALNGIALLVFDNNGFDDELHFTDKV